MLSFHRKEQYDLACWPWLCVHREYVRPNGCKGCSRVFCLWEGGLQVGSRLWRWGTPGAEKPPNLSRGRGRSYPVIPEG